jgi:hypothetical protein
MQLWRTATNSSIMNAPWYMNNCRIREDLHMNTVHSEIEKWSDKYLYKLKKKHTNALAVNRLDNSESTKVLKDTPY